MPSALRIFSPRHAALLLALQMLFSPDAATSFELTPAAPMESTDPLQIVVSLNEQSLTVFQGDTAIRQSHISSGKPGHETPTGIFSILSKAKYHRSNIYSNAPMPWMQRLTWTGIALHESNSVPDYPASHGCVRMPGAFAKELFSMTQRGVHVVITGAPQTPQPISSEVLPNPAAREYSPQMDHWRLAMEHGRRFVTNPARFVSTASMLKPVAGKLSLAVASGKPLRVLITRRDRQHVTADVQLLLAKSGYDAGPIDGLFGRATSAAVLQFQRDRGLRTTGTITPEFTKALWAEHGRSAPASGHIYVRQDFKPVYEAAIAIDEPETPLGTHLFTTHNFDATDRSTGWLSLTLENQLPELTRALFNIDSSASHEVSAEAALARIHIPEAVMRKLSQMLTPGSSISISDTGLGPYTGWNTDFVVATRI